MDTHGVINASRSTNLGGVVFGLVVFAIGLVMLFAPVRVAEFSKFLDRGRGLGGLLRSNDPAQVRQSFRLRLEYRIAGAVAVTIGLSIALNELKMLEWLR